MEGSKSQILDGLYIRKGGEILSVALWIIWRLKLYLGKHMILKWMFGVWEFLRSNWLLEGHLSKMKLTHKHTEG